MYIIRSLCIILSLTVGIGQQLSAQINEKQLGAWYMYFWNTEFEDNNWGALGSVEYLNWNLIGDLEQFLVRGEPTFQPPNTNVKLSLGYLYSSLGTFGPKQQTTIEHRTYFEALLPQLIGNQFYFTHRFRFEQRFVENQDFRTRYRYALFINIPLNQKSLAKNAFYIALYSEIFINGERDIGNGNAVQLFDRNRSYGGIGYSLRNNLRFQLGFMQEITDDWSKPQLQLSAHHRF